MAHLCVGEIITSVEGATEILATVGRTGGGGICSVPKEEPRLFRYNLLNINKIPKYSHKNEQN